MGETDTIEETIRKMDAFIKRYNQAIEEKKKELEQELRLLIRECAQKLKDQETIERVYSQT